MSYLNRFKTIRLFKSKEPITSVQTFLRCASRECVVIEYEPWEDAELGSNCQYKRTDVIETPLVSIRQKDKDLLVTYTADHKIDGSRKGSITTFFCVTDVFGGGASSP